MNSKRIKNTRLLFAVAVTAALLTPSARAATFYVDDATGDDILNDGTSWSEAYETLQKALDVAAVTNNPPHQIWVAAGTYHPDEGRTQDPLQKFG